MTCALRNLAMSTNANAFLFVFGNMQNITYDKRQLNQLQCVAAQHAFIFLEFEELIIITNTDVHKKPKTDRALDCFYVS